MQRLKELENLDVISKVVDPTLWLNYLLVVEKPN